MKRRKAYRNAHSTESVSFSAAAGSPLAMSGRAHRVHPAPAALPGACLFFIVSGILLLVPACTRINVVPTCPSSLAVGEEGTVAANPIMPGAVPTYQWEVIPAGAGEFTDATAPTTTFRPLQEGQLVVRVTASDSLFVAVGECTTTVGGEVESVTVALSTNPNQPTANAATSLICESTGLTTATMFEVTQTGGTAVDLTESSPGVFVFTPATAESLTFQCVGRSDNGTASHSAVLTFAVAADTGSQTTTRPPTRNGSR